MRRGVRIGVDVGTVRVGVSRCDPDGILTMPVVTLTRAPDQSDLSALAGIVREHDAIESSSACPGICAVGKEFPPRARVNTRAA